MSKSLSPTVTTIVLTWNSALFIEECLESLKKSQYKTKLIVIDNNSSDSTRTIVSKQYPSARLVNTQQNLGYAGGNNFGIRLVKDKSDYIFILNPDATIAPNCITELVSSAERSKRIGIISPIILLKKTETIWYAGSEINFKNGSTPHTGSGQIDRGQYISVTTTDRANGCAMLVRSSAVKKVGLMDETYFLYYDETDWSMRFKRANYKIGLAPKAKVWHAPSSSTGGSTSSVYEYYMTRNKLYFLSKYSRSTLLILPSVLLGSAAHLGSVLRRQGLAVFFRATKAQYQGYRDYALKHFGKQNNDDD